MNKVIENIKNRRSIRKYLSEQIKEEELNAIIEAGAYAPSGHNGQPWHFTVIQNKEIMDHMSTKTKELMASCEEGWIAKMGQNPSYHLFHHAPTIVIVSGSNEGYAPIVDCSAAIQNMLLAAESLNIGSCWIGLTNFYFSLEEEVKKLNLPEGHTPFYTVCLGYKGTSKEIMAPKRKENIVTYIK